MSLLDKIKANLGLGNESQKSLSNDDSVHNKLDEAKSEQDLCKFIKDKVDQSRASASRVAHESIWMQNCAYTIGFAGLYFDTRTRSFVPMNRASAGLQRNRMHVNKILPNLQNRLAKLTKNPPRWEVRPNDMTQEGKDNARFKTDILLAKLDELRFNLRRQEAVMWAQQCGHAYFFINWDDSAGQFITDPLTGEGDFEGDIRLDICSPFEIFPDELAKTFDESKYFIRAKVRPLSYFRDQFPEKGGEVKEEETWLLSAQFETRINSMNTRGFSSSTAQLAQRNTAIELCYLERPSRKHPRGRMIICANGVLLKNDELPVGKLPLAKIDDILVAGKFYSESVVTHVKPLQDQYNACRKRTADWVNKMLAGKYISPRGNELIREALTDVNAEVVQYTPVPNAPNGGEPRPLDIPMIPSYVYTEQDKIESDFSEIMGISEVSKGQLPSASIPALGMQILVEADDTRIGVEILNHEFAYSKVGELILDYVQKFYVVPRKMKFAGKNAYVIKDVSGDMLEGSNDVIVIPGSTIPGSKALRRQEILNAYSQSLLGDPADPVVRENVLGMLELGDVGEVFLDHSLDQHRIKMEIEAIENGQMPDIDEGFNHPVHIKELNRYRKSDKFEMLSDEAKAIFMAVREEHLRFAAELSGAFPAGTPEAEEAAAAGLEAQNLAIPGEMVEEPLPGEELPQETIPQGV